MERFPSSEFTQRTQENQWVKVRLVMPEIKGGTLHSSFHQSYRELADRETQGGLILRDQNSISTIWDLKWQQHGFEIGGQKKEWIIYAEKIKKCFAFKTLN